MCQSKAEGGRRCAYHLEHGVCSGLTTYVVQVTGLTKNETTAAYEMLEREGVNVAAPTREEVDQFLENQIFRVRHEPDLTEKRRESIINRLRAAIGRILPSGATFHAWKNLVAEAWSRVRRKAAAAFVIGALTFSVGACGNAPNQHREDPVAQNVAAAPATPGVEGKYDTSLEVPKAKIAPAAVQKYGKAEVTKATDLASATVEKYGFNDTLMRSDKNTGESKQLILSATKDMTPDAAQDWRNAVNAYTSGDAAKAEAAASTIYSFSLYSASDGSNGYYNPATGPVAVNKTIRSTKVDLQPDGRLAVQVDTHADLRVVKKDSPDATGIGQMGRWNRKTTYYMQKTDQGWKIDGWSSDMSVGQFVADN